MTFRENYAIVEKVFGIIDVNFQALLVEKKDCENVGNGSSGSGVPCLSDSGCHSGVNSDVVAHVL